MNKGIVLIDIRLAYGKLRAFPANELGQLLADLIGQKSFTKPQLLKIKQMGFTIEKIEYEIDDII